MLFPRKYPSTNHHRQETTIGAKSLLVTIGLVALLSMAMFAGSGCSGEDDGGDTGAAIDTGTQTSVVNIDKGTVNQEDVENMILRKVGTVDYAGDPIIRQVALTEDPGGTVVTIGVGRPPSCHPGQVVGYITEMSRGFMSSLFLYEDVSKVEVSLYGTTEDVADSDVLAASAVMTREDADKIDDWFAFDENTISQMATEYWVEPQIYANWQQFGSAAISDPALLEEANQ